MLKAGNGTLKAIRTFDTLKRWVRESYRAQAPKRLLKELETKQPWIAAGGLPG